MSAPDPKRTREVSFCCDARPLAWYTPHDPWVWGQRDEAARVHYALRRCGCGVAARGERAAGGDPSDARCIVPSPVAVSSRSALARLVFPLGRLESTTLRQVVRTQA